MRFGNKNKIKISTAASFILIGSLFLCILGITAALVVPRHFLHASSNLPGIAPQAQDKKPSQSQLAQISQLNQQIGQLQNQVVQKLQQQADLRNEINLYDLEMQETELQLQATQTNINNDALQIAAVQKQIADKTAQAAQEKQTLADLLVNLDKDDNLSQVQLELGTSNFSDFLNQIQYTHSLQNKVYNILIGVKKLQADLESDNQNLHERLAKLNELKTQLTGANQSLSDQKAQKVALLADTKGQEYKFKVLLNNAQAEENEIAQEIGDLNQQAMAKGGNIAPIRGILAWPLQGIITQGYGNTGFTALGYDFHNGVDIAGPPGCPIYAAADGVVQATGTGQAAYGNWVAIKHNIAIENSQIITLYGHLMSFIVTPGQNVKQGDLIGFEGNTGNTTRILYGPERGFHLHFSVFDASSFGIAPGKYQNKYGPYQVPYGHSYNPLDFLNS